MSADTLFVFALILLAGALMASNRIRFDIVALLVVLTLMLSEVLTVEEAIAGFGSPVVALVAGLLVIGEMLSRTGVARVVGDWVLKQGGQSETRMLILIMGTAALLGSVMSSTVVVALFIPIVMRICRETQLNASRMLIPLSYAALISGMLTLIATTPNIVVHEALREAGYEGFHFFSFSWLGLAILLVAILYILLAGRHLLSPNSQAPGIQQHERSIESLWLEHCPGSSYQKLLITDASSLDEITIGEAQLARRYNAHVVGIFRKTSTGVDRIVSPDANVNLRAGTTLILVGKPRDINRLAQEQHLEIIPAREDDMQRWLWDISGAAILIHPESQLVGKSLRDSSFRSTYGVHALGMRRNFKAVEAFENQPLQAADSLFVVGHWTKIQQLSQKAYDFVLLELPREHSNIVPSYNRLGLSLLILAAMVLLTLFNIVPLVPAVMMAALAAVLTRCLSMEEAYRSIQWSSLVLIAGMLPLANALNKTGGTQLIADTLMSLSGGFGPYVLMSLLFFLTAAIGLVLANTAAAVLVSPIAIVAADSMGLSPYPFAIAVLIAASSSFSTPVATPVVTLVVEPGHYRFVDFVKTGLPLLILTYVTTLIIAPLLFPF